MKPDHTSQTFTLYVSRHETSPKKEMRNAERRCLTLMSRFTSCLSSLPLPSLSYILNDHLSRSSRFPRRIRWSAATYSRKSSVLSWKQSGAENTPTARLPVAPPWRPSRVSYLVGVEGAEYGLYVERLLGRAARHAEDPLELVQVQGAAGTLLHEEDAQLLDLGQVHLLAAVALLLAHGPRLWLDVRLLTVRRATDGSPHSAVSHAD